MKIGLRGFLLLLGLFVISAAPVVAQSACPTIVGKALTNLSRSCSRIGRNQACYGNLTLIAQPQPGVTDLRFAAPGDIESITRIASLTLSSMNSAVPEWGVALMSLQASLPNVLPGQSVIFLLFGSARFSRDDATAAAAGYGSGMQAFIFASGIGDAQCGEAPDSGMLVQTQRANAEVVFSVNGVQVWLSSTAYIQSANGSLLIYIVEGKATVSAQGVSRLVPAGTFVSVPIGGDGRAAGAPSEPQGYNAGIVQRLAPLLRVLPRRISLAPALDLSVCTLIAPANANTRQGPGTEFQRTARLNANVPQQASGATVGADGARWYQLATGAWVSATVVNAFGPCDGVPQVAVNLPTVVDPTLPRAGVWMETVTITQNTCDPATLPVGFVNTGYPNLIFNADRSVMRWDFGSIAQDFVRTGENVYVATKAWGNNGTQTVTFTSPTTFIAINRSDPDTSCIWWSDAVGTFNG